MNTNQGDALTSSAGFDYEAILNDAEFSHKSYVMGIRGQTMTERDSLEWHVATVAHQAASKSSAQRIQELESLNASLQAENANLRTVMMAGAVEITEHWDAHCDEDGCGPANLVSRLENGFPEQYGYDAETVVRMEKQIDDLRAQVSAEALELVCHQRQDSTEKWVHMNDEDIPHYQGKGQPIRALYAKTAKVTKETEGAFSVYVEKMEESHRVTYWVRLVNEKLRPVDAQIYDNTGQIHPYYSEELERAEFTAQEWAEFLGVEVTVNSTLEATKEVSVNEQ
ncbi:MAG: hypothetical protein CTY38_00850 [Methylotenera sp.]|uniref:hypothetical protein n=1 Tax=Methylotenera sp. TaxID=2051956 RepID=UPI000D4A3F7C|nr:hypothetical protein [Methylotenera sp.]PPC84626.1 MAG: hypothetical protein CTY38_00850 [Methylotenera sp.]